MNKSNHVPDIRKMPEPMEFIESLYEREPNLKKEGLQNFDCYYVHWNEIIKVCQGAWPELDNPHYWNYWNYSPTELILDIIEERDEAQSKIDRLTAENKDLNFRIENLIKRREEFDKNVAKLTTENGILKEFASEVIKEVCWDLPTSTLGELDDGDIQDFAERLGLIVTHILTKKDIKEYPDSDFEVGGTIYVFSEILKGGDKCK